MSVLCSHMVVGDVTCDFRVWSMSGKEDAASREDGPTGTAVWRTEWQ